MSRKKNPANETIVKGVRAKPKFWQDCETRAKKENKSRNELIVSCVQDYCDLQDYRENKEK